MIAPAAGKAPCTGGTLVSSILCQQQTTAESPESGDIFV